MDGEHVSVKIDLNIKTPKHQSIYIDLDFVDADVIILKKDGEEMTFPILDLWKTLKRANENGAWG